MTSLGTKRLDSSRTASLSSGIELPVIQQTSRQTKNNNNNLMQLKLNTSNPNQQTSTQTPNSPKESYSEIPIQIIRSTSYINQIKSNQPLDKSGDQNQQQQNSSSFNLNNSDNIADINTDTLKFNKYGFIQSSSKTEDLYNTTTSNPKSPTSTLNRSTTNQNNNNNNNNNNDASFNTSSSANVTNLKDYLQNTDVEEFAENIPIKVIQQRELKWVEMLSNFDEWMDKRFKKIKSRCRKGIPQSMRSKAWMHLTGAIVLKRKQPSYYQDCLQNPNKIDVAKYVEDIKKDLHRQFPSHEIFMKREGRQMLFNVLKAYAVHNREVGYCQAQGPIAALLLMHMPEEDAFWMLIRISDFYLKEYYKPGLEKVQIDGHALFYLFKKENSTAHKLMLSQGIDPILYMTEWFMCVYARTLPWCTVLRVWDMFFCEGIKVLYRVGLYLMMSAFSDKLKFQRCQQQGMYETLNLLKNLPIESLKEADLVRDSVLIKINEAELKKAFEKSKQDFIKERGEIISKAKQAPEKSNYVNTKKKS